MRDLQVAVCEVCDGSLDSRNRACATACEPARIPADQPAGIVLFRRRVVLGKCNRIVEFESVLFTVPLHAFEATKEDVLPIGFDALVVGRNVDL